MYLELVEHLNDGVDTEVALVVCHLTSKDVDQEVSSEAEDTERALGRCSLCGIVEHVSYKTVIIDVEDIGRIAELCAVTVVHNGNVSTGFLV